ncbi:carboxypeptidase-like regulatory domain-containing protein [Geothermobacter hydrogeniphilus]|nr:carboxypeptidase-like regulatory domain-containing protein [Geothermobacter hydrogeniphilus]
MRQFPARYFFLLMLLFVALPAWAGSGVKGRAAWRGELVPGLRISAYRQIADIPRGKVLAVSEPTALDGTYQLELPPGSYVLVARSFSGEPKPGDYFCYYSGSPIQVQAGHYTNVGFNLIRVPAEPAPRKARRSGLQGEISYQGELLEKVYLYVYRDTKSGFKGPAYNIVPVEKGKFRLRLPPGDYYLLARKRLAGGRYGPVAIGDYFNFYYGNPVHLEKGTIRSIHLETITRLSNLEQGEDELPFQGVRGRVFGADGAPVAGLYVFAYRHPKMTGTPDFFSAATDAEGRFALRLPPSGRYYLLARQSFGGPAAEGELYGKYSRNSEHRVELTEANPVREVEIHVQPISAR